MLRGRSSLEASVGRHDYVLRQRPRDPKSNGRHDRGVHVDRHEDDDVPARDRRRRAPWLQDDGLVFISRGRPWQRHEAYGLNGSDVLDISVRRIRGDPGAKRAEQYIWIRISGARVFPGALLRPREVLRSRPGRFLSGDPAGEGYVYARDSPTNLVDPTGMASGWAFQWCTTILWWSQCWIFYRISYTEAETRDFMSRYISDPAAAVTVLSIYCWAVAGPLCAAIAPFVFWGLVAAFVAYAWLDYVDRLGGYRGLYFEGQIPGPSLFWHN